MIVMCAFGFCFDVVGAAGSLLVPWAATTLTFLAYAVGSSSVGSSIVPGGVSAKRSSF